MSESDVYYCPGDISSGLLVRFSDEGSEYCTICLSIWLGDQEGNPRVMPPYVAVATSLLLEYLGVEFVSKSRRVYFNKEREVVLSYRAEPSCDDYEEFLAKFGPLELSSKMFITNAYQNVCCDILAKEDPQRDDPRRVGEFVGEISDSEIKLYLINKERGLYWLWMEMIWNFDDPEHYEATYKEISGEQLRDMNCFIRTYCPNLADYCERD